MPAARYWRLSRIESFDYGDLVLSEVALYEGASRVDSTATISSVIDPSSGALANLSDTDFGTSVTWAAESLLLPGFAVVYDFGTARDIVKVGVAGPEQKSSAYRFALDYSSDGVSWTNLFIPNIVTPWINSTTLSERTGNNPGDDEQFANVEFLMRGEPALVDLSRYRRPITPVGSGSVSISETVSRFGSRSIRLANAGLQISNAPSLNILPGVPFTFEGWFRFDNISVTAQLLFNRWSGSSTGWVMYAWSTRALSFQVNGQTVVISGTTILQSNTWYHIALSGQSGVGIRMYLNGVQEGATYTGAVSNTNEAPTFNIGWRLDNAVPMTGNVNDVRLTIGVDRYPTNFTPPAAYFLDEYGATVPPLRGETPVPIKIVEFDSPPYAVSSEQPVRDSVIEYPIPAFGVSAFPSRVGRIDQEDGGGFQIVGTVKEVAVPANTPLSRRVALHEARSGRMVRQTFSDSAGNYLFDDIRGDRPYNVIAYDHTGVYRAVIADNISATPRP